MVRWRGEERRKPLVVRGARQVGKTTLVESFGRTHFEELVAVDLERSRSLHRVFEGDLDAHRLLSELRLLLDRDLVPGRSLLFFDEIQACPRALMALRYLYEEVPELHVIAAGSLLEFALDANPFPVGRVRFLEVHPMGFAEFLCARGRGRLAALLDEPPRPLPVAVHRSLLEEVRTFFFVGGMPEAVKTFVDTGSLRGVTQVHRDLIEAWRQDVPRYAGRADPDCIEAVLRGVARYATSTTKYSRLAEGWSPPTLKRAFELLVRARLVSRVPSSNPPVLPLGAGASARVFKALLLDIGLLQAFRGLPPSLLLHEKLLALHEGALAEQFVGQELRARSGGPLHFWSRAKRGSTAEVDYLGVAGGRVHPIEVKSGAAGRLRGLHLFLRNWPHCGEGLVFSARPYGTLPEQRLVFLPLYYAGSDLDALAEAR